jgi:hypothetical protein
MAPLFEALSARKGTTFDYDVFAQLILPERVRGSRILWIDDNPDWNVDVSPFKSLKFLLSNPATVLDSSSSCESSRKAGWGARIRKWSRLSP